jgi:hypothetical protein
VSPKSFTFTRILCHIADLMEGNLDFCQETPVQQNVLITSVVKTCKITKANIIDRELADFTQYESPDQFKALISKLL